MSDPIDKKKIVVTVNTFVAGAGICISLVSAATFGYFRLDAKANIGVENRQTLEGMKCDVRQLKNFMIYGVKPDPLDRCEP